MKNKKILSISSIIILISVCAVVMFSQQNSFSGRTTDSRQLILNKSETGVHIASEVMIQEYIVSEITNVKGEYGYALFEPQRKDRFKLQTKVWRQKGEIVSGLIRIEDKAYELFMCNEDNLSYAEVSYRDNQTELEKPIVRLDLLEGRYAYIEAPNLKDYTRAVSFYDVSGNKHD